MVEERVPRILLVEDNPGDVVLVRRSLLDLGAPHELEVADDGVEALGRLRRDGRHVDAQPVDLVLLDINLPRMDGHEVLAAMKADTDLRRIPVVVLTSSSADADVLRAYDHHANAYLTKGFGLGELSETLRCLMAFWVGRVTLPPRVDG